MMMMMDFFCIVRSFVGAGTTTTTTG